VFQRVQYCIFKCSFKTHSCTFIFNYTNGRDNALFLCTFGNTLTFNLLNLNIILLWNRFILETNTLRLIFGINNFKNLKNNSIGI
jgi:hypothetical protein